VNEKGGQSRANWERENCMVRGQSTRGEGRSQAVKGILEGLNEKITKLLEAGTKWSVRNKFKDATFKKKEFSSS